MTENATVITITELVHGGRAITGASSLFSSTVKPPSHSSSESSTRNPQSRSAAVDSDNTRRFLEPLNYPGVIVGTLALPSETLKCPNRYCFRFTDGNLTICCDILGLEIRAIGSKICVLSWNFLSMSHFNGFLEIIKWKLVNTGQLLSRCTSIDSFPLVPLLNSAQNGDSKSRYSVHCVLESISPVSVVPCMEGDSVDSLVGGNVALSGLKKKLVYTGKCDSLLVVFVTTENSVLRSPWFSKKQLVSKTVVDRKGNCGSYLGFVKGLYMKGKLVELDEDVWILLTDQIHNTPHSVRTDSLIFVRNVHFVNTKFSWGEVLTLGACFNTSIT
ncbi:unnamed protein product [Arabis nemorensis]|uniref:CST complex subunit CTC1 n=1 Tax=Arabis nemorensis TaxID=586526 RepID=A0A565C4T0_9BRAS|nr:unnamed protein product [Arabis nemorensis]